MAVVGAAVAVAGGTGGRTPSLTVEVTTVADDGAVLHDGVRVLRHEDLDPDTEYERDGVAFRTLPRPSGERLATVAAVNDLHFGETVCGVMAGVDMGPPLRVEPGEPPYPETMSRAAASEIAACQPDAVVVKGDLTSSGTAEEFAAFLDCFGSFGDRLHWVRGNHDARHDGPIEARPVAEVVLPGVVLALLDTALVGRPGGALDPDQLEWLDDLGQRADRPVLVFGHHPLADLARDSFGLSPQDSERLVSVVARRPSLLGYFAGHTHRNRVRRLDATGEVPWVEVAATKDFPGGWAEYRVFEGGVLQVFHRISTPEALRWSERTRAMFGGLYPAYSFGTIEERCFVVWPRTAR